LLFFENRGIIKTNDANLGLQRRECELRYEFYIDSTEHMNTEGWRGMGLNDESNIYSSSVQILAEAAVATAAY
jgi:hypothetical protein